MNDDIDLIERIESALEHFGNCPWLPDLTGDLVQMGWRVLYQEAGLSPSNYGTSRVIAKSVHAARNLVGHLSTSLAVEVLDENLADNYKDAGIEFYTVKEIGHSGLLDRVDDAINLIKRVPTLHETVDGLVRSVHLIKPKDDDYDVSFSEPQIPFSIFISIPREPTLACALRISEAIVHESMHLQLTLIERTVPLTISTSQQSYSPWREEYRDTQGILHALYVFRVIDQVLRKLGSTGSPAIDVETYIHDRYCEIASQIREVRSFQHCSELTNIGACFVRRLI
jgi:HEXXH motif-containing protein